ncbi:LuxR C-terminal-related transcriptional regulator [Xanthomonas campestris pv. phormiicola]|nr:LuxR C-terminal-related transcriptional regulator [Xanthomonas campestris pv. phormiicola]UYC15837.1 LuxR C-terminal-related transcriptional regulator [Xanthomonas campestris pv. phormiicola]
MNTGRMDDTVGSAVADAPAAPLERDLPQWSMHSEAAALRAWSASAARPPAQHGWIGAVDVVGTAMPHPPMFSFPIAQTPALRALQRLPSAAPKLVSVVAPIGYGKTVLLSVLHHDRDRRREACWWFSLDDRDTTASRLLSYLEARLDALGAGIAGFDPSVAVHQGGEPEGDRIRHIVARLQRMQAPLTLFIDNVGYCRCPEIGRLLEDLVFETPPWVRVVLSSTEALPIDLLRCKLEGLMEEYGVAELSFDEQGIREVFGAALCAGLTPASIHAVLHQTEGWPAAVRLMQILLSSAAHPAKTLDGFSGQDQDIATLLNTQVLKGFAPELRGFLLRLSLLRDFDAGLASQATGVAHAQAHLDYLWRHNVFLIPVDGERRYRLHNLFRGFLEAEARRELTAAQRTAILERAAIQCDREARCADAIDYALSGGSVGLAVQILERTGPIFVRDLGYLGRYLGWVKQLHAAGEFGGWETDFWYVWALVFRRRYEQAREQMARLSARLQQARAANAGDGGKIAAVSRRIDIIRITIGVYTDRQAEARRRAGDWLATITDQEGGASADAPFDVATIACAAAILDASACRLMEARRMVRIASASIAQAESAYGDGWVMAVSALIPLREGDYATAYRLLTDALHAARRRLGENAGICGTLSLLASSAAMQMDLRDEAQALLLRGLQQISTHGILDTAAHGLETAVKLWPGEDTQAVSLVALRAIAATYPPRLSLMLSCFIARRLLQLGRIEEAQHEACILGIQAEAGAGACETALAEHGASLRDLVQATRIELLIASGKLKPASACIAEESVRARAEGRSGRLVELALDEAFLSQCTRDPVPAARHLTRAISLASRRRHLRPFRDRSDLIAGLVNDTRLKDWPFVSEEERRFFAEVCAGLEVARNPVLEQMQELDGSRTLSETPTARELELLGLIEGGLSNQEIADRLSLSLATVKWHLYNLYAKLGVKNRASALARARALNLLAR